MNKLLLLITTISLFGCSMNPFSRNDQDYIYKKPYHYGVLNKNILNIMSNFIPNEVKTFGSREPEWLNRDIKNLSRNSRVLSPSPFTSLGLSALASNL